MNEILIRTATDTLTAMPFVLDQQLLLSQVADFDPFLEIVDQILQVPLELQPGLVGFINDAFQVRGRDPLPGEQIQATLGDLLGEQQRAQLVGALGLRLDQIRQQAEGEQFFSPGFIENSPF